MKTEFVEASSDKCSAWTPWFAFAFRNDPISRAHRLALELARPKHRLPRSAFYTFFWPLKARCIAFSAAVDFSSDPLRGKKSFTSAFWMFWWLLVRHNMTIESSLRFRIWRPENLSRINDYIQHHEIVQLLPWLSRNKDTEVLDNKVQFEQLCRDNDLPCPLNVATLENGRLTLITRDGLPHCDLFTKIDGHWGGSEGQIWCFDPGSMTWSDGGSGLDQNGLSRKLSEMSPDALFIIQPLLRNGVETEMFSSGALCTVRVVTARMPGEKPTILKASLRMPVGDMKVDNLGSGGLAAGIDAEGRLTAAVKKADRHEYTHSHPDTGAKITDEQLVFWEDVVDLALTAHSVATDVYFVGWDIAWTDDGPKIIDANVGWGEDVLQMPGSRPLGADFYDLIEVIRSAEGNADAPK